MMKIMFKPLTIFALVLVGSTAINALASPPKNNNNNKKTTSSRRQLLAGIFGAATSGVVALLNDGSNENNPPRANAACIAGDTSLDCIGSYKDPIPKFRNYDDKDAITIKQKALMKVLRADTEVTIPDTIQDAIGILEDQKIALEAISKQVQAGQLQDAGVLLLAVTPKVTVSGRYVVSEVSTAASRFVQTALERAEQDTKTLEKTIMLGMKGHKGAMAAAQLAIMEDLAQAKLALEDLIEVSMAGAALS